MTQHVVSVSGGKDSAACYLLAIERGVPFRAVTADTGHEAEETYEWIRQLSDRTGGPSVEVVRQDFTIQINRKRDLVKSKWVEEGVDDEIIAAALDVLHPTGIPFLDLCLWKGRFPSRRAQFCTEWLKSVPIYSQVFEPIMREETLVRWQGERRDESPNRANLPRFQKVRAKGLHPALIFRPIVFWNAGNTFEMHRRHGLTWNPLYEAGMTRVGCFPCINANKGELKSIKLRAPDVVEKLLYFERLVSMSSKRGQATFFAPGVTPERTRPDGSFPKADRVMDWAETSRGGKQYDLLSRLDDDTGCSSEYGLCE